MMTKAEDFLARADDFLAKADADPKYNESAVSKEIAKDKRIKPGEAKKIHALLKGWRGDAKPKADAASFLARADAFLARDTNKAFDAGFAAAKGKKPRTPPYRGNTDEAVAWHAGYDDYFRQNPGKARADAVKADASKLFRVEIRYTNEKMKREEVNDYVVEAPDAKSAGIEALRRMEHHFKNARIIKTVETK